MQCRNERRISGLMNTKYKKTKLSDFDISPSQASLTYNVRTYNIYHFKNEYNEYLDLLPEDLLRASIEKDISTGYKISIPGFRSKNAPFSKKVQYIKSSTTKPFFTTLEILIETTKNIKQYQKVLSFLINKFKIKPPMDPADLNIQETCSIDMFNSLKQKQDLPNLVLLMSVCGILITDKDKNDIKNIGEDLKPREEEHNTINVEKYIKLLKSTFRYYEIVNSKITDLSHDTISIEKLFEQPINKSDLKVVFEKINRLEISKSDLQLKIEKVIEKIEINRNQKDFDIKYNTKIFIDLTNYLSEKERKISKLIHSVESYYSKLRNSTISINEFDIYNKNLDELKELIEKAIKQVEEKTKRLEQMLTQILLYKKQIKTYLEDQCLIEESKLKHNFSSKLKIDNINSLRYPSDLNNMLTSVKEQKHNIEHYLSKTLKPFEKDKILKEFKILGKTDKEQNEISKEINTTDVEKTIKVLKKSWKYITKIPTKTKIEYSGQQTIIIKTSNEVMRLLFLLKYFMNKNSISDNELEFLITSIKDISISNSIRMFLLVELSKKINNILDYKKKNVFSEVRAKYLAIIAVITRSQNIELHEYFETGLGLIPFNEHKNLKKIFRLISEDKQFEISESDEIENLTSCEAHNYFKKDQNRYSHPITRDKKYGKDLQPDLQEFFHYIDKNIYLKILSKASETVILKQVKMKLEQLNEIDCWKNAENICDYNRFPQYRKEKLAADYNHIKESLVDLIEKRLEYLKRKRKSNHFSIDDVSDLTIEIYKFVIKSAIFDNKNVSYYEDKALSEVIKYMMNHREFYLQQNEIILQLYSSEIKTINMLIDNVKIFAITDKEEQINACLKLINNKLINKKILNITKDSLGDRYKQLHSEYLNLKLEYSSYTSNIHRDYREKYINALDSERYGFVIELYSKSEQKQRKEIQRKKEQINTKRKKLNSSAKGINEWIMNYPPGPENDILTEVFTRLFTILLKKDTKRFEEAELLTDLLIECKKTKIIDIDSLREWLVDFENNEETLSISDHNKISTRDLRSMLVGSLKPPSNLVKRVEILKEKKLVIDLLDMYLKLWTKEVTTDNITSYNDFNIAKGLLITAAKCFRLYSDLKTDNCQEIGTTDTLPFFVTDSYYSLPMNRKIIMTCISNKRKQHFGKSCINRLGPILKKILEGKKKYSPEGYFIICFVSGDTRHLNNVRLEEFDNLLILDSTYLVDVLTKEEQPADGLKHHLVRGFPLAAVNPFVTERPVTEKTGVFVKRGILTKLTKNNDSYAIYGARRVGKTSICKFIRETYEEKNDYICEYFSVGASECKTTEFKEVFSIGIDILHRLRIDTSAINSNRDFANSFSRYLTLQKEKNNKVWIIIDEFDRYLKTLDCAHENNHTFNDYAFINVLRDMISQHDNFKLIISGFMSLYDKLNKEISGINKSENPWVGFVSQLPINVLTFDEAKSLVNNLKTELDLEFDQKDLLKYIINKTSLHPAYIQYFLRRLVNRISSKTTLINRNITKTDIDGVFDEYLDTFSSDEKPFIEYVDEMLRLNIDDISMAIIAIIALEKEDKYKKIEILNTLKGFLEMSNFDSNMFERSITTLKVTQVINETIKTIEFKNTFWKEYLNRILEADNDEFDSIINKAKKFLN